MRTVARAGGGRRRSAAPRSGRVALPRVALPPRPLRVQRTLLHVKFATKLEAATRAGVTITDRYVPYDWELQYMGVKRRSQMPERAASHGIVEPSSIIGHAALTLASDGQMLLYCK